MPCPGAEPGLDALGKPSHQREPLGAKIEQPIREALHMVRRRCSQLSSQGIVPQCPVDDKRGQRGEVSRSGFARPADNFMRIEVEALRNTRQKRCPGRAAVERPKRAARHLAAEPCAATLVRNREAPATNAMTHASNDGLANTACADDDNAAILPAMRSNAGGMRVRRIYRRLEGMLVALELGEYNGLSRARKRKAGDNDVLLDFETCVSEAAGRGGEHFRQTFLQPKANVCRTAQPSAQRLAFKSAQPGPAACAAAVNSKKKRLCVHLGISNAFTYLRLSVSKSPVRLSIVMDTERPSPRYAGIDVWEPLDALDAMIDGQLSAVAAVRAARRQILEAALAMETRLKDGGRLVYAGAGTSGRLAVQDGAELMPTFSWPEDRLLLLLAGGEEAMVRAVEGAEDEIEHAAELIRSHTIGPNDVLIAVAASGATPFTLSCLREARRRGALTIGVANNPDAPLLAEAECPITLETGSEPIAGSTRMNAGTAQRITLSLLSSLTMIRLGQSLCGPDGGGASR